MSASCGWAAGGQGQQQRPAVTDWNPVDCDADEKGSPLIPVDSWIYPAVLRLYSLGYADQVHLDMRPWTAAVVSGILDEAADRISDNEANGRGNSAEEDEARSIYEAVRHELRQGEKDPCEALADQTRIESVYSGARVMSGTPLEDSFHLGSTIINDYGRPFENGFNNYTGVSGYISRGRFVFFVRGESQGAPSASGYSAALGQALSVVDETSYAAPGGSPYPQATIPQGPIASIARGRILEAYVSAQVLNHIISFGKQDEWLGPGLGASMAYSNNAENIYAFHINRIKPLFVPLLSSLTGAIRYEFVFGALQGHTLMPNPLYTLNSVSQSNVVNPGNPWVHVEKISFKPTVNLELGFERTVIFGGEGHSPVTLHTFLKSFFSTSSPSGPVKNGRDDPGARFGAFDFSYRLPFVRNWLTLYSDSEVHDDISPVDAPRRASWRPGLYLSHVPGAPHLDLRVEAATTDPPPVNPRVDRPGTFMYWEQIEKQGYTNHGQLFGDWIGREDKGGQAWMTYHLSGNQWIQINARSQKASQQFIPGGTTLNDLGLQAVKRLHRDVEMNGSFTIEHWKAPIYLSGQQTVTTTQIQVTWTPGQKLRFR